jgi:hypothetical protein
MLLPPIEYGLDSSLQTNVNPTTGKIMRYGNVQDMEECLAEHHERVAAVIMECLHGALKSVHQIMQFSEQCLSLPFCANARQDIYRNRVLTWYESNLAQTTVHYGLIIPI